MGYGWIATCTSEETKVDRAGHIRQLRQAQDHVVLTALAVWPDGNHEVLHYEIAEQEDTQGWEMTTANPFQHPPYRQKTKLGPKPYSILVSTQETHKAYRWLYSLLEKAAPRFELGVKDLQSSALPLGHAAAEAPIYQTFES